MKPDRISTSSLLRIESADLDRVARIFVSIADFDQSADLRIESAKLRIESAKLRRSIPPSLRIDRASRFAMPSSVISPGSLPSSIGAPSEAIRSRFDADCDLAGIG